MCDGQGCRRESTVRATLRGGGGAKLGDRRQPAAACAGQHGATTTADKTQPAKLASTLLKAEPEREREVPRRTAGAQAEAAGIDRREMLLHLLLWGPN
ncbi:uncharacterized protein LOC124684787 [Lolium rigidum]|uniref:uncharacterized protein LOC124684787 n=1 Tax=Lolium rigidum TaxID=89674 RepID=UPI001F5C2309|nr:uncharacterized protein LOC124684787 [Lolium rigidum]